MYDLQRLLQDLRNAMQSDGIAGVERVVRRAVQEKPLAVELSSSKLLHGEAGLTVLHIVVNSGFVSPPNDHRTWAVIGVYSGQEANTFYRLIDGRRAIEQIGGRNLGAGEVMTLAPDAIHSIANPGADKLIALHVYGKNILEIARSAWDLTTGHERPFSLQPGPAGAVQR
jgi:predicted metal-dependent enzyme (double-stranded beta helix superfamily)